MDCRKGGSRNDLIQTGREVRILGGCSSAYSSLQALQEGGIACRSEEVSNPSRTGVMVRSTHIHKDSCASGLHW